jgi:hypothetical protein
MPITLTGDGSITGLTATGISAVQQLPAGSVIQVVQGTYSTSTQTSTSTFVNTGLTATITPKFATSKILVIVNQSGLYTAASNYFDGLQLLRGASSIATIGGTGSTTAGNLYISTASISYLDSPATTSPTTYLTQFRSINNNGAVGVQIGGELSTITLMEIAQ